MEQAEYQHSPDHHKINKTATVMSPRERERQQQSQAKCVASPTNAFEDVVLKIARQENRQQQVPGGGFRNRTMVCSK